MSPFQRIYFFSDLHLTDLEQPLARSFLSALKELNSATDAVVLAGDIFEILVGDSSYFKRKYESFFAILRDLVSHGVSVFYIEGNHDFHLARILPSGVSIVPEGVRLEGIAAEGPPKVIEVVHGDLVDSSDHAYLKMRRIFRSRGVQLASGWIPGPVIEWLAGRISRDSDRKASELPEGWSEARRSRLREVYRDYARNRARLGVDFVIMGHCHDLDEADGVYWNMGYPPVHRQFLVYDPASNDGKESISRRYFLGI